MRERQSCNAQASMNKRYLTNTHRSNRSISFSSSIHLCRLAENHAIPIARYLWICESTHYCCKRVTVGLAIYETQLLYVFFSFFSSSNILSSNHNIQVFFVIFCSNIRLDSAGFELHCLFQYLRYCTVAIIAWMRNFLTFPGFPGRNLIFFRDHRERLLECEKKHIFYIYFPY